MLTASVAGLIVARAPGPAGRGEYAAVVVWFGVTLIVGEVGLTAATTCYVARDRDKGGDYVATARWMMTAIDSTLVILGGTFASSILAEPGGGSVHAADVRRLHTGVPGGDLWLRLAGHRSVALEPDAMVRDNFFDTNCGTNLVGPCLHRGRSSAGKPEPQRDGCIDNVITGNYFENACYLYGVKFISGDGNHVVFNGSRTTAPT